MNDDARFERLFADGLHELTPRRAPDRLRTQIKAATDEVRPRLFEPYFTTRSSGTGLGLAIARRVIEEAGGTIELVPAEPGPGTIARIQLPAFEEPNA
jgi:nitrogen fixation/metabolism regulation signal transduction histidine kinase